MTFRPTIGGHHQKLRLQMEQPSKSHDGRSPGRSCDSRSNYGQNIVKEVLVVENLEQKVARHRNHVVFNMRCRDLDIIPTSLKLKCCMNTDKGKDIIKKASKEMLRKSLRVLNNKLDSIKQDLEGNKWCFFSQLPSNKDALTSALSEHLSKSRDLEYCISKEHQQKNWISKNI